VNKKTARLLRPGDLIVYWLSSRPILIITRPEYEFAPTNVAIKLGYDRYQYMTCWALVEGRVEKIEVGPVQEVEVVN
jgi:hypothetical protein